MCKKFAENKAQARKKSAEFYGVPLLMTEFGACFAGQKCVTEINSSVNAFDDVLAGWTYWQYKSFGDHTTAGGEFEGMFNEDGSPQAGKMKALARTYMHAFQGTPIKMFFNPEDSSFTCSFTFDAKVTAPSEIYAYTAVHYPEGYIARADTDGFTFTEVSKNYISLQHSNPDSIDGKVVSIVITRKTSGMVEERKANDVRISLKGQQHTSLTLLSRTNTPLHTFTSASPSASLSPSSLQGARLVLPSGYFSAETVIARLADLNFGQAVEIDVDTHSDEL